MILVLCICEKYIRLRHVDHPGGELRSGVCATGTQFFLILSVFAVDTNRRHAAGSGGMMCAFVILRSAPGMLCRVRHWCVLGFVWRTRFEVGLLTSGMIGVSLTL